MKNESAFSLGKVDALL